MRISDWSSDVCSSDLRHNERRERGHGDRNRNRRGDRRQEGADGRSDDTQATAAPKPRRQPSAQDSGAQAGQSRSSAPTTANGSTPTVANGENGNTGRSGRNPRGRGRKRRDETTAQKKIGNQESRESGGQHESH